MKLAIMQPYLFPYIGYFQLINAVDKFVIYDDVAYIKRGWINRNYILVNNQKHLFTINLNKSSQFKLINEISIKDDFHKFLKTIRLAYTKAPYYQKTYCLLEKIVAFKDKNLANFVTNSILIISESLEIKTRFKVSSALNKDITLKKEEKILSICKLSGADMYINASGGQELYNKSEFAANNLELNFLKTDFILYKQFNDQFVPCLSIIDVMMFNSPEVIRKILNKFELE